MDDGLSSIGQEAIHDLNVGPVLNDDDVAEDASDILKREKQLEQFFNEYSDDDDDESSSSDDESNDSDCNSKSSGEESVHNQSQSEVCAEQQSITESYVHSANEPKQHSALISHKFSEIEEHSALSDSDASDASHSKISDVSHSKISDVNHSRASDLDYSEHSNEKALDVSCSQTSICNERSISNDNHLYILDADQSKVPFPDETENQFNYEGTHLNTSNIISKSHALHTFPKSVATEFETETTDQNDYGDIASYKSELQKLQILCDDTNEQLGQVIRERNRICDTSAKDIKALKLKLQLTEGEKEKVTSSLREAKKLFEAVSHDNNVLKGKLTALEIQLSHDTEARKAVEAKLQSAEITIESLEQRIKELNQSDNAFRLQQQNESIVKELKLRHQKETLKLKEEIDKLQENLSAKINESDTLSVQLSQLQKKCQELQTEKHELFNKLSAELDTTQRKYKELLESGTTSEIAKLRLQLEILQEEKSKLEKQTSALKDKMKILEGELRISETVKSLKSGKDSLIEKNNKSQNELDMKAKLQKSLEIMQSLRAENRTLKEELEQIKCKLPLEEKKAKQFESRYKETEMKLKELQKKLIEVLPTGSIPVSQHEKKVLSLENELEEYRKKFRDLTERFKISSSNESKLLEERKSLNDKIEKHRQEVKETFEKYKKRFQENHEEIIATMEQKHKNEIAKLQKEIQHLHDELYDAKARYVETVDENKSLLSKINSMSQIKERDEIEKEIKLAYEKKFNKMKEEIQKEKNQFESALENERKKFQIEWTNQKMFQVEEFINQTKQQLDEEFLKFQDKEKSKFEEEKKKILNECQEKINNLQNKYEEEKNLNANLQLKWENERKKLQQDHEIAMDFITKKFEKERVSLENEIKILKEKSNYDFELKSEMESLHNELKQHYEEQKNNFAAKLKESFQEKWKNKVKEMQQDHQKEIDFLEKSFQHKINTLEDELKTLKENLLKESNSGEIQILKEEYDNAKVTWHNEKIELMKSEHILQSKLSTAVEVEKKLLEKNRKLKKYIKNQETVHKEKADTLQKQNEELKKSITNKENELKKVIIECDYLRSSLEEKHQHIKTSSCQTEDEVVSRIVLLNNYEKYTQCLKSISDEVNSFLAESRKNNAERLKKALSLYHDRLISKIYQDVLKDARSISPNIGIPRVNRNLRSAGSSSDNLSSPTTMHHQLNSNYKISNSTPLDAIASSEPHKNLEFQLYNVSNVKGLQSTRSTPEFPNGFGDMSFDFVPVKMHDLEQTSVKIPHYSVPGGLFHAENIFHSYPQRDLPRSNLK